MGQAAPFRAEGEASEEGGEAEKPLGVRRAGADYQTSAAALNVAPSVDKTFPRATRGFDDAANIAAA